MLFVLTPLCAFFCVYFSSSFDQLRLAANNLKKQATKKNLGSLPYVKGGLSTFFEAQDALAGETCVPLVFCGAHKANER